MLFSSITFLYYFLPVVLFFYYILPFKYKNGFLLFASLFFYGWGEPFFLLFMGLAIVMAYFMGIALEKYRTTSKGHILFPIAIVCSLLYLGYFKYADFFLTNVNRLLGTDIPLRNIVLPIGISFYTFQLLSYLIDIYKGNAKAKKNIISFALYISMFPQLIAGPIVRYTQIESQLELRTHSYAKFTEGMTRFILGLAKKVLIANPLGELCTIIKESQDLSVMYIWLYAFSFALHIYYDFSGYSDMAIGLGKIFGFSFSENFNYPFISKSVSEFWNRWHISLGNWFRDYVYIPLGGNRVSPIRFCFNLFITWFLTGLWHGAGWNFILWGLYYGVLLMIEKIFLSRILKKHIRISHIYVLFFVIIGFVIFDGTDYELLMTFLKGMFGLLGYPVISAEFLYYLRSYGFILIFAVIGSTPCVKHAYQKYTKNLTQKKWFSFVETILITLLCLIVTAYLVDGSYNPFLYFRF